MPRKKKSTDNINPLNLSFGLALKQLRGTEQSSDVAITLGVGNSFIRLLETGATKISPGRALKLLEAFPQIEFQPLSKLLIAINITDAAVESLNTYRNSLRDIFTVIKDEDLYFENALTKLNSILGKIKVLDQESVSRIILAEKFHDDIVTFLTNATIRNTDLLRSQKGSAENKKIDLFDLQFEKLLGDTTSIYIDSMSVLLKNLKTINPNLFVQDSSEWEKVNSQNFVKLVGIFTDFKEIMSDDNLKNFDYRYLQNDWFKELNYIILNADDKDYRRLFIEKLKWRWDKKVPDEVFEKVKFKKASSSQAQINDILSSKDISETYTMVWIFITNQGNKIGFGIKGGLDKKKPDFSLVYGESLSYSLSKEKYGLLEKLWTELN